MDLFVFLALLQDGITTGAIYLLTERASQLIGQRAPHRMAFGQAGRRILERLRG